MSAPSENQSNPVIPQTADVAGPGLSVVRSLSAKLLLLTLLFVMIAEVLIFVPSVANFRNVWLKTRLDTAEAASIVFLDSEEVMLSEAAGQELLKSTMALNVAIRTTGASQLMATRGNPAEIIEHIDLDSVGPVQSIISSLGMLFARPTDQYRVFGTMRSRQAVIELVQEVRHIQKAIWAYAINVLLLSLIISVITAGLVYFALYRLIVRPIIRISSNMEAFSMQLENTDLVLEPSGRQDEIGVAEEQISSFQKELQKTLRQKQHLADLGLAVSKINHDMRNILSSAQLFSDRLTALPDPTVQRFAPKLIRAIDRAVDYTKSVLDYGKAIEAPPKRRKLLLYNLTEEISQVLGLDEEHKAHVAWSNRIGQDLEIDADPEQLFRVIMNLCRNAVQAMREMEACDREFELSVSARRDGNSVCLKISDNGPGIPDHIKSKIFNAFEGSTRAGGTGLGVTIAAELIRAHGGTIEIAETSEKGTSFEVVIPDSQNGNGNQSEVKT